MGIRRRDHLGDRVINALYTGHVELIETLFACDFLKVSDRFDNTGRGGQGGNPEDCAPMLTFIAEKSCPDYKDLIDIILKNGGDVNEEDGNLIRPIESAIFNKNYRTAIYLESKGGTVRETVLGEAYLADYNTAKIALVNTASSCTQ